MLTLLTMGKPALCCKEKVSEIKEGGGGQRKSAFHLFMVTCCIVPAQGRLGGHMKEARHRGASLIEHNTFSKGNGEGWGPA